MTTISEPMSGLEVAHYPSTELPGIPAFTFPVPEEFLLERGPNSLAVLRAKVEESGFTPNLIVSHDEVAAGVTLRDVAVLTLDNLRRACTSVKVEQEKTAAFPDRPTYLRVALVQPRDSLLALMQVHASFLGPVPDTAVQTRDLFHLVGVCPAEPTASAERWGTLFVEVVKGFAFSPAV